MRLTQNLREKLILAKKAGYERVTVTKGGNWGNVAFLSRGIYDLIEDIDAGHTEALTDTSGHWAAADFQLRAPGNIGYRELFRLGEEENRIRRAPCWEKMNQKNQLKRIEGALIDIQDAEKICEEELGNQEPSKKNQLLRSIRANLSCSSMFLISAIEEMTEGEQKEDAQN